MKIKKLEQVTDRKTEFLNAEPFPHLIIDDFLERELAEQMEADFPKRDDERLFVYKNPLEDKFALNDWNIFPSATYQLLQYLNSPKVVSAISQMVGVALTADNGIHGGGWHMHGAGGRLNPHLDYSIHPKVGLQRKINLILYLTENWQEDWGGHLGFWRNNVENNSPQELVQEVAPRFNRAVIFDTTKYSWHGISRKLTCPEGTMRKSLAVYYLCEPDDNAEKHQRALYAPTKDQEGDESILQLIKDRADATNYKKVYKT